MRSVFVGTVLRKVGWLEPRLLNSSMTEELIRAARRGDQKAVGELLHRHTKVLRELASQEICRRDVGREDVDAVDPARLVQRTLQIAEREFRSFAGSSETQCLQWLRGILHRIVDAADRQQELRPSESGLASPGSQSAVVPRETNSPTLPARSSPATDVGEPILSAIELLPAVPRDVIRLRLLRGWTIVRLARHLGLDEVTVAGLLRQSLRRLCEIIEAEGTRDI